jgi:DNA-binding transcriptional LysR family regulator
MQVRSFDAVCHMVASGMGIAILPKAACLPILTAMKISWPRLADPWAQRRLLVACALIQADAGILSLVNFLVEPSKKANARTGKQE